MGRGLDSALEVEDRVREVEMAREWKGVVFLPPESREWRKA